MNIPVAKFDRRNRPVIKSLPAAEARQLRCQSHRDVNWRCFALWVVLAALASVPSGRAQNFQISSTIVSNGLVQITFPARADSYYYLHSSPALSTTFSNAEAVLGVEGDEEFRIPARVDYMFFRIEQIATNSPYNYLRDGIPDGWKLLHQLNPLDPTIATSIPPGDTRTWYEIYTNDLALAQMPVAYFPYPSSTVIAGSAEADIPVSFTKPFTGRLTYHLSGTAIATTLTAARQNGDYFQPLGYVDVTNRTTALITIALVQRQAVEADRSLLVALSVVPGATNQAYTIAPSTSVHTLSIAQSLQGIYAGTLLITNGLIIGPQQVKMAIRLGSGNSTNAFFDVTGNPLLGDNFSVPVTYDANGFQVTGGLSRQLTNTPFGWPITLTLALGATQTNGGAFTVPASITLNGLTASGVPYTGAGYVYLTRLQSAQP